MRKFCSTIFILLSLTSCSMFSFSGEEQAESLETNNAEDVEAKSTSKFSKNKTASMAMPEQRSTLDEIELKQAQLWTRIDELEAKIRQQKQKIKVLEQGLMLGVVPKELQESLRQVEKVESPKKMKIVDSTVATESKKSFNQEEYKRSLNKAKNLFRSGRYGKAYLAFTKVEKEYENLTTDGESTYWLGRCWAKLREFQSAKKYFEKFLTEYPDSPLSVSGRFHLGKTEMQMGLNEIAIKRFQKIIKDHPYEGTAEAARQVLANFRNSL